MVASTFTMEYPKANRSFTSMSHLRRQLLAKPKDMPSGTGFGLMRLFTRKSPRSHTSKKKSSPGEQENESTTSTMSSTETTSIHRFDSGRRYNARQDIPYLLPNDEEENDRAHQQHWMINVAFGSNFDAPVHDALEKGIEVLDSGCGPATWTLDMAEKYPNSTFNGTDISPRFPQTIKPPNCHFLIHNIVDPAPFPDSTFTFIHQRLLSLGILESEWEKALADLMRTLKPGGWIELLEISYAQYENAGPKVTLLMQSVVTYGKSKGLNPGAAHVLDDMLTQAGAVNISSRRVAIPLNHGGKLGDLFWDDFKDIFMALFPIVSKIHPDLADIEDYKRFLEACKTECSEHKTALCWYRSCGQKPNDDE
ncbi:hypothetical protein LRAMOSA11451 [Lichtheimia ramosa]|uniref:Methyltransferase domain-containing protein n=1 Tax=Lichtheimia ramosa TaxID=688394 RepID=A0A077WYA9_9FUNG|nr:hypothetical protein LRAMOSA11451 [Lichtheimia ramosa]